MELECFIFGGLIGFAFGIIVMGYIHIKAIDEQIIPHCYKCKKKL
jgi:hypothetical protein